MAEQLMEASFSGHETFPFRYGWLKKGVDAVGKRDSIFNDDDAMTVLGVGKNMVRSIRHWCLAAQVIEDVKKKERRGGSLGISSFGRMLFAQNGFDPYLEDACTLWLLHWQLASASSRATTWYWAFSCIHEIEFSKDSLAIALERWIAASGLKQVSTATLQRDIDCFLHTYVTPRLGGNAVPEDSLDCPLAELRLIRQSDDSSAYSFNRGPQLSLPDSVVLYAVLDWWTRAAKEVKSLSLYDVAHRPGSPGRVLKIDEDSLVSRLEKFERLTDGRIVYDETAGLKQLFRRGSMATTEAIRLIYRRSHKFAGCT